MGFSKVYKSLQELFPQIDARVLRAVAIEHRKDADAAAEAVLVEIIPFFTERSRPSNPFSRSISVGKSSEVGATATTQTAKGLNLNTLSSAGVTDDYNANEVQQSFHAANDRQKEPNDTYDGEGTTANLTLPNKIHENSIKINVDDGSHDEVLELIDRNGMNTLQTEVSGDLRTEDNISANTCPENNTVYIPCHKLGTLKDVDMGVNQNTNVIQEAEDYGPRETEFGSTTDKENDQEKSCVDDNFVVVPDLLGSNLEKSDASWSTDIAPVKETTSNAVGAEDESSLNATMSQSSQIRIVDVLDELIADARNNKSVITLMREVELKEQDAEHAKEEAGGGGASILVKVEELERMLQHAKEANDMHDGEVYGEKAILATELRELQSRVLSLSDERDKSLTVLNEMRQTLEVRLTAAENEIKLAEQEKLQKENAAAKALADQEFIMQKMTQESSILKQQAEENAKLREFLMDRGRVVDMLQGEIAVICQDVQLLKEKFDEHVPFSKSLSSSQTSFILASSTSSLKSVIPEQVEPVPAGAADSLETRDKGDITISQSDEPSSEDKVGRDEGEALLDDGWEIFDNREIYA